MPVSTQSTEQDEIGTVPDFQVLDTRRRASFEVEGRGRESVRSATEQATRLHSESPPAINYQQFHQSSRLRSVFKTGIQCQFCNSQKKGSINIWSARPQKNDEPLLVSNLAKDILLKPKNHLWSDDKIAIELYNRGRLLSIYQVLDARRQAMEEMLISDSLSANTWSRTLAFVEVENEVVLFVHTYEPAKDGDIWHLNFFDLSEELEIVTGDYILVPQPRNI